MQTRQASLLNWLNKDTDFQVTSLELVSGDASNRHYYRFHDTNCSYLAVDAPPQSENTTGFARVAEVYAEYGIRVPQIMAIDLDHGFYCLEDFGKDLLQDKLTSANLHELYQQALCILPAIQACQKTKSGPLPVFDQALLDRDFGLFNDWFVGTHLSFEPSEKEKGNLSDTFFRLRDVFFEQPQAGSHRDYHSRNLMLLANGELGVIDFQDALIAPITYDLASLLRDCYSVWPDTAIYPLVQTYHAEFHPDIDWMKFKRWFDFTTLQRHIKICGIFSRLYHRDGKAGYLADIPVSLKYINSICRQYPELSAFGDFIQQSVLSKMAAVTV